VWARYSFRDSIALKTVATSRRGGISAGISPGLDQVPGGQADWFRQSFTRFVSESRSPLPLGQARQHVPREEREDG
jgi:hypothetical protein